MEYRAYIGLGSNLGSAAGDPAAAVRAAVRALAKLGTVVAESSLYRTAPVGYREQPYFVNAAACLETELEPEELLQALLAVERSFGRERSASVPKGPRTLDLDLLLMEDARGTGMVRESAVLTLPHPEIAKRKFVLEPLAEIAAEARHPATGETMRELLEELAGRGDAEVARI